MSGKYAISHSIPSASPAGNVGNRFTANPTPGNFGLLTDNPTPLDFGEITENPTPSGFPRPTDIPTTTAISLITENPTPYDFGKISENPTPGDFEKMSENPTPAEFELITENPTPADFGRITENPTPSGFPRITPAPSTASPSLHPSRPIVSPTLIPTRVVALTANPTPATYGKITGNPTPAEFQQITVHPTPTDFVAKTGNPTPFHFIPPPKTPEPTMTVTASPSIVAFTVTQGFEGMPFSVYEAEAVTFNYVVSETVALTVENSITYQDINIRDVSPVTMDDDASSLRSMSQRLLTGFQGSPGDGASRGTGDVFGASVQGLSVLYNVDISKAEAIFGDAYNDDAVSQMSSSLITSVNDGQFTATMQSVAASVGAAGFANLTSTSISVYVPGSPTMVPSDFPTLVPTFEPSTEPSLEPSFEPTYEPSLFPTQEPTLSPTREPTWEPTLAPTSQPTLFPTFNPTSLPSEKPTFAPTDFPTYLPTTSAPTTAKHILTAGALAVVSISFIVLSIALVCVYWRFGGLKKPKDTDISSKARKENGAANINPIKKINEIMSGSVILHSKKAFDKVTMKVSSSSLDWEHPRTGKRFRVDLAEVTHVLPGKQTPNFRKELSVAALGERCFSLECPTTTVDIETSSKDDRDALVILFKQACVNSIGPSQSMSTYDSIGNSSSNPLQSRADEESARLIPGVAVAGGGQRPELTEEGEQDNEDPTIRVNSILFKGILLHTGRGPQQVSMSLVGSDLRWFSAQTGKQYVAKLSDLISIQEGKTAKSFDRPSSVGADPAKCFSLVFQIASLDLEAESNESRDILVYNLRRVLDLNPTSRINTRHL